MDANAVMKKQFAKLHEKVQSKYDEMQRKLEKSKSIDMLTVFNEDYMYKDQRKFLSVNDLSKIDEEVLCSPQNGKKSVSCEVIAGEIYYTNNVTLKEIICNEATITESVSQSSLCDRSESENDDKSMENFFGNNFLNTSLESLNELSQGDESLPPTPTHKIIRKKIGWLRAAKEKRKRDDKEKTVKPKTKEQNKDTFDRVDRIILCNTTKHEPLKTFKRTKIAGVTIALIEATGIDVTPEEKPRILVCRFRLGSEKRKSKSARGHKNIVKWQEIHHFNLFDDDSMLEISLNDKDDFLGRTLIDLSELEKEKTHKMTIKLDYSAHIKLFLLLTISGTSVINTVYEIDEAVRTHTENAIRDKYAWYRICDEFTNVGHLSVIVYGAKGLPGNDWYCVLNLNNERIQTPTDFKTNSPSWMKIFSFTLNDITSILDVTICDEKRDEEHGKVSIPLLSIENGKKWYALKENTQRERAKGNNPRILLEMSITWNLVKASVRVINPKEVNYLHTEDKLDRHMFAKNLTRSKAVLSWVLNAFQVFRNELSLAAVKEYIVRKSPQLRVPHKVLEGFVKCVNPHLASVVDQALTPHFVRGDPHSRGTVWVVMMICISIFVAKLISNACGAMATCPSFSFEWESQKWSFIALIVWQLFCWFFKMWMLPLLLLIPFVWYRPEEYYLFNWAKRYMQSVSIMSPGESKQYKEEKNLSLRQKLTNFQETLQTVQNVLGKFATLGERFKNLFNFSVPFVSFLAIFFILVIAFVVYLIPLRYIMMGWGIHKFTRKILRPNRIPNNEVMDLLSRVPDDNELMDCEELPLDNISDEEEFLT